MKKPILVVGLLTSLSFEMQAQQPNHYIFINAGGGLHSLSYDLRDGKQKGGAGFTLNGGYSYFFSPQWAVEAGLGVSTLQSSSTLSYTTGIPATDTDGDTYEFRTYYKGWKEKQTAYLFDIPLGIRFQKSISTKLEWTAGIGASISLPLSCRYKATDGEIATTGYYSKWNAELTDMPQHGFSTISDKFSGKVSLNPSYAGYANLGALYKLSANANFYAGTYVSYGFNSMVKASDKLVYQQDGVYNGVLSSSEAGKARKLAVGVQVGFRWSLGQSRKEAETVAIPATLPEEKAVVVVAPKQIEEKPADNTAAVALAPAPAASTTKAEAVVSPKQMAEPNDTIYARAKAMAASVSIKFDFSSNEPKVADVEKLKALSEIAKATPAMKITIVGHTCNIASKEVNQRVGMERAQAVKELLLRYGVPNNQLQVESKASDEPVAPNTSRKNRMKNRRVELKIH
ncbi:OmpA family protein [uncultured Acetobacteroides sp.]|uniref:OmpA family protein n=1 Tax=uncultured Acetobacteroides sp. TaxID=1760811 RepID=UPI0029F564FD|nr:OmpA family protein [uncultured Acetobacteroides sp.]